MRVLIVKTSSLGDIIHTLPALTDASRALPNIRFDWVVEEAFQEIPAWHPSVDRVIPVALRRWRKQLLNCFLHHEFRAFKRELQTHHYDVIIDAQGLIKSAAIAALAKGKRVGLDKASAKEGMVARSYHEPYFVSSGQHAIQRVRTLFALALDYPDPQSLADANLHFPPRVAKKNVVFLHGTTWQSKHWPDEYWCLLAEKIAALGMDIQLPWGNETEKRRADDISSRVSKANCLGKLNLTQLAEVINASSAVVGVDTGLMHLAAALNKPSIALFGATNSQLTGIVGEFQQNLQSNVDCSPCMKKECVLLTQTQWIPPCYQVLSVDKVFSQLQLILSI